MSFKKLTGVGVLAISLLSTVDSAVSQQARWADPTDPTAQSLIEMERHWAESACTRKVVVETILAEDFQGTSPDGKRYSKAAAVADEKNSKVEAHDCRLLDAKVHFLGDSTALVYGSESSITKGADGNERTRNLVWTDTWLKRDGKWQIVAAQDTRIPENSMSVEHTGQSQPSVSERLVGTWRLVSRQSRRANGELEADPGLPLGVLVYDQSGHVAAQSSHGDRTVAMIGEECQAAASTKGTPDTAQTILGYNAYFGTYRINENEGIITHHLEAALFPGDIGKDIERHFTISGDQLTITFNTTTREGGKVTRTVTWERIK